ncbi:two-component system osmolarity sensor histidine kinase EnvZ [Loktanella sp. PT4BL]|jgi:two-component system osmolarity sensor histidine kinase EnvZ|uniref:ATP-binding protein n=1 Tax=Loktanella sp. PT4BL TaxID=2135611 RepID=UPI000D751CFD|nr:ATP-binding protein [Loktanella sp. PT4BL]PXW70468.1 two-component system osmolarity sensor histidine kinase EnvZ [Loktanella sp. PT4BL]
MFFGWLKKYMPRGIYARAALILVMPILLLQLLVSVVFIQRHFEGVTRLMTSAVNIELRFLVDTANTETTVADARTALARIDGPLEIDTVLPADDLITQDILPFVDLTGGTVIETLRAGVNGILAVSLEQRSRVVVWVDTRHGPLRMDLRRARVSASNPHQLLVIMVVLGGIMTAIAYVFLRNQLRPIKRMARAATDYGKGRITPFTPTGAIEVRAAGMAFLDMRNRLERQTQSRTMMLSGVSHDLRTPLTRLRLGLSMLDPEDAAPLTHDVDDMERLLDAFLDFARTDAGDSLEPTIPGRIIEDVLADATRMQQNVTLGGIEGAEEEVSLRPLAIRRAMDNLVGNALRYGTRAEIGVSVTDRAVRFWVEDDGPGIPPERYDEALSPFVRLDPARNQDKGSGVGLGLSIVADIARTHGGVLRLGVSERLGGLKAELVLAR